MRVCQFRHIRVYEIFIVFLQDNPEFCKFTDVV